MILWYKLVSFLKRHWLTILVVLGAILTTLVWLFSGNKETKQNGTIIQETLNKVQKIKEEKRVENEKIIKKIEKDRAELKEIKKIDDKMERLNALAAYANSRRKKK